MMKITGVRRGQAGWYDGDDRSGERAGRML